MEKQLLVFYRYMIDKIIGVMFASLESVKQIIKLFLFTFCFSFATCSPLSMASTVSYKNLVLIGRET